MISFKQTLYGLDKNGGFKQWSIWVEGNKLFIEHGKENGKLQLKEEIIGPKNVGRANETSPEQQAILEAKSRATKQIKKGYRENKEDLNDLDIRPMLSADYHKQGHKVKFPCLISPKLDGVRCLARKVGDEVELISRGGENYHVPHIQKALWNILEEGEIIDGEIYKHGFALEEIVSAVKKWNDNTEHLEYWAFDFIQSDEMNISLETDFENRYEGLTLLSLDTEEHLNCVTHLYCQSEQEMLKHHKFFVSKGYEGIMLRNLSGVYESGKRSTDLQKYKEFCDHEFKVLDVVEDRNGNAVFVVQNAFADNTFDVCGGSFEERKEYLKNKEQYIGKYITVKYQSLFKDTKLPQFPVMVCFRDEADMDKNI